MHHIFYLMGKSASGKDTLYQRLLEDPQLKLHQIVLYTTRPIRQGEEQGREYFFTDEKKLREIEAKGHLIELRSYDTVQGIWHYFTADDGQIHLEEQDYLGIGTLESYRKMKAYYGEETMVPLYIEVEDGDRLMRALTREKKQKSPDYAEVCRRFLADSRDFSEENLLEAGITHRFLNANLEECMAEIEKKINSMLY
jgi:guanylate kinase